MTQGLAFQGIVHALSALIEYQMNRQNLRLLFTIFVLNSISAIAQSPAFTYQGRLDSGGSPASGIYDLRFTLYDEAGGGVQRGAEIAGAISSCEVDLREAAGGRCQQQ